MNQDDLVKENEELRRRIEKLEAMLRGGQNIPDEIRTDDPILAEEYRKRTPIPADEGDRLAAAQARADMILQSLGEGRALPPYAGETSISYRRRLAAKLQRHSPGCRDIRLNSIPEGGAFDAIENKVYADAQAFVKSPQIASSGRLIPITYRDEAGRLVTRFEGDIGAWLNPFKQGKQVVRFTQPATA